MEEIKKSLINGFFEKFKVLEVKQVNPKVDYSYTQEEVETKARKQLSGILYEYLASFVIISSSRPFKAMKINDEIFVSLESIEREVKVKL